MCDYNLIVSVDEEFGLGKKGILPWHISSELKYFKRITETTKNKKRNAVIMGRKCWESIPLAYRPLPNRLNIILTRNTTAFKNKYNLDVIFHYYTNDNENNYCLQMIKKS